MRLDDVGIDALAATLKRFGIKVAALETPVFKCPLRRNNAITWGYSPGFSTDMTLPYHFWYLDRAFEIADRLEVEQIRCFSFWREYPLDDALDDAVNKLGAAAAKAEAAGKRLYLQNQPDTLAGTGVELARIVKAVNSSHLKAAYDVANSGAWAVYRIRTMPPRPERSAGSYPNQVPGRRHAHRYGPSEPRPRRSPIPFPAVLYVAERKPRLKGGSGLGTSALRSGVNGTSFRSKTPWASNTGHLSNEKMATMVSSSSIPVISFPNRISPTARSKRVSRRRSQV